MMSTHVAPWRNVVQIWGANTDVGKTVVSTLLCRTALKYFEGPVHYVKPVSTGPAAHADDRRVFRFSAHENRTLSSCASLLQYPDPLSPHIAAANVPHEEGMISDPAVRTIYDRHMRDIVKEDSGSSLTFVETFGGPMSPMVSMNPQADAWRPYRLPAILVGDSKLGGISTTISAYESLLLRGYDIMSIIFFQNQPHDNVEAVNHYFRRQLIGQKPRLIEVPRFPPQDHRNEQRDVQNMAHYYKDVVTKHPHLSHLLQSSILTMKNLSPMLPMAAETQANIWHPFQQHKDRTSKDIMPIDSAYEDFFNIFDSPRSIESTSTMSRSEKRQTGLNQTDFGKVFDGSASWWTQGLGHGDSALALSAAHAAGRYGHVMFAGATHQPATQLARSLLSFLNRTRSDQGSRMQKAFFSDNGSTGIEVAVKMGIKAATKRYEWADSQKSIEIIGLVGAYHGDTMGAMDCSEPNIYNEKVEWYRGRGFWFDFPKLSMKQGKWIVECPPEMQEQLGPAQEFQELADIFSITRDTTTYEDYIRSALSKEIKENKRKFGALIIEPVILGAGGMLFADPAFQRALVNVVRTMNFSDGEHVELPPITSNQWSGLPIIFDEVFTGMFRLGQFSSAAYLGVSPDISVHAKLLTGGLLPLCLTVSSDDIFGAFLGDEKSDALLHGHSYTAHPIGCSVANSTLLRMKTLFGDYRLLAPTKDDTWRDDNLSHFLRSWNIQKYNGFADYRDSNAPNVLDKNDSDNTIAARPKITHESDLGDSFSFDWAQAEEELQGKETPTNTSSTPGTSNATQHGDVPAPWSIWERSFVEQLSFVPEIERVNALGSVLAFAIRDPDGAGYASNAAASLRDRLLASSPTDPSAIRIHSRVLGNVLYIMGSLVTPLSTVQRIQDRLLSELGVPAESRPALSATKNLESEVERVLKGPLVNKGSARKVKAR